ncbi:acyltransferase family protein [Dermatophilus congolensis]|uniref:acyltransferase family protein n=1 Tax=Dermatophilus congolensis TaxID=1863 RepID=UPI00312C97EB
MTTLLNSPAQRGTRAARHTRVDSLDGIRALAVIAVIAYHVSLPGAEGGFLGVDVFFVLSGFLITTLLMRELTGTGRIDLGGFWVRRVLRLLPASLLLIVTVVGVSAFVAAPFRRADIGADALWSLLYVGNWRFIDAAGYFSNDGSTSPLQHVWSLAVEEQFYVVWPLLLVACVAPWVRACSRVVGVEGGLDSAARSEIAAVRRVAVRRGVFVVALVVGAASAVWFAWLYDPHTAERAYMGTDTRVFAPLVGAAVAACMQVRGVQLFVTRRAQPLMALGLVGVVAGLCLLGGQHSPRPAYFLGGGVAFAVVVAVLVAATSAADRREGLTLVLGSTPLGWIGRISYGMYLWHWPLVVWIIGDRQWSPVRAAVVVVATVVMAQLSYTLVEVPLRTGRLREVAPVRLLPAAAGVVGVATMVPAVLGGTVWNRVIPAVAGPQVGETSLVLVGDSVIQRLLPALDVEARRRGVTVLSGARGGCPALLVKATDASGAPLSGGNCAAQVGERQAKAVDEAKGGVVVWWSRYEIADRVGADGRFLAAGSADFWDAQIADFRKSVDALTVRGARLVVVEMDRPGVGLDSRCSPTDCPEFLSRMRNRDELRVEWNSRLREYAASDPRVSVIRMDDLYCRNDVTPCDDHAPARASAKDVFPSPEGSLTRPDGAHFSPAAAPGVAAALLDRVAAG